GQQQGVPHTYVHFFGDGRDTAPTSAAGYCQELLDFMKKEEYGELATVVGRYYAMDRNKRWERVKVAVDRLVGSERAKLTESKGVIGEIKANYDNKVTDEFLKPIIVNGDHDKGRIKDGDTLLFFNYRSDGMSELVTVLGLPDRPTYVWKLLSQRISSVPSWHYHHVALQHRLPFPVAFPPQAMTNVLAEWLSKKGIKQAHIAGRASQFPTSFYCLDHTMPAVTITVVSCTVAAMPHLLELPIVSLASSSR
ncbi:BPG-independent, partial [Mycena metata]